MVRAYNVIDADGHILEPLDLWDKYIDPAFRDRGPADRQGRRRQGAARHRGARSATASAASAGSARSGRGKVSSRVSKYGPRELRPLSEDRARQVPPPGVHPLVRTHP